MPSFDSEIREVKEDFFNRQKIASQILSLVRSTRPDWSVRLGLYGDWGEGKSSVLRLVKNMAPEDEFVIVEFSPSSVSTSTELWKSFISSVTQALEHYGLSKSKWWKNQLKLEKKALENYGKTLKGIATLSSVALGQPHLPVFWETGSSGLRTIIEKVTKSTDRDEQLKKIQKNLKNKKFLVLIDDLDRANPDLIPELLLSLRDVLDLPGFAFVLAFDYNVITSAIGNKNKAWGDGRLFLEKIIDFPVSLNMPTNQQNKDFLKHWHEQLGIPIELTELNGILEHLPSNPRKIKLFIRQLAAISDSLSRFGPDDVDIRLICLWLLMRIDFPDFSRRFVEDKTNFESMEWLSQISVYGGNSEQDKTQKKKIGAAIAEHCDAAGIKSKNIRATINSRLEKIAHLTMTSSAEDFSAAMRFWDEPVFLTKLESERFIQLSSLKELQDRLNQHATDHGFERGSVYQKFYELQVEAYDNLLSRASNQKVDDDQRDHINAAEKILDIIISLLESEKQLVSAPNFSALFSVAFGWAHFTGNKQDRVLRAKEKDIILSQLELVSDDIVQSNDDILRWVFDESRSQKEAQELAKVVATQIDQAIADDLFQRFSIDGGIESSFDRGQLKRHNYLLFDLDSIFWKKYRKKVLELLKSNNPIIIENAYQILRLIRYSNAQFIGIPKEEELMLKFKADKELPLALWNLASSRPLQFRSATDFEEVRGILERGTKDIDFKKPEWMKIHLERLANKLEREGHVSWDRQNE